MRAREMSSLMDAIKHFAVLAMYNSLCMYILGVAWFLHFFSEATFLLSYTSFILLMLPKNTTKY